MNCWYSLHRAVIALTQFCRGASVVRSVSWLTVCWSCAICAEMHVSWLVIEAMTEEFVIPGWLANIIPATPVSSVYGSPVAMAVAVPAAA